MATGRRVPSLDLLQMATPAHERDQDAGFSLHEPSGTMFHEGTFVSQSGTESAGVTTSNEITEYRRRNAEALHGAGDAGRYLGGWGHGGEVYMDLSRRFTGPTDERRTEARTYGREHGQIGIYDTDYEGSLPTFEHPNLPVGQHAKNDPSVTKEGRERAMQYSEHMAMAARAQAEGRKAGSMDDIRSHASVLADQVWDAQQVAHSRR